MQTQAIGVFLYFFIAQKNNNVNEWNRSITGNFLGNVTRIFKVKEPSFRMALYEE